jgi:hypothetical protein
MKRFQQFLTEQHPASNTIDLSSIYGALRLAGIHAGERDSLEPFVSSRSMMGIHSAAQKVQDVLRGNNLILRDPYDVNREGNKAVHVKFHIYHLMDETRRIGQLSLIGEINPIDKGTMAFRAHLDIPDGYSYPSKDLSSPKQLY